ncbi:MAG: MGH1-like glycoside hydrolase domain-containing protein [Opitutaceae bacterium]
MAAPDALSPERRRLGENARREKNWERWGPYLSERQWGTVREDYGPDGESWRYLTHDQARSRAYRWGEDGLLGIADRECRLCFAVALWNEADPILKERLFGLTGFEGNHGEDVKECHFYLEATPTHSWLKALYKYPQARYPYERLIEENGRRSRNDPEFELADTGVFDEARYFDVFAEYAKGAPNDLLIRITVANRGPQPARLHVLPTLWYRNTWSWGRRTEAQGAKPRLQAEADHRVACDHETLGRYFLEQEAGSGGAAAPWLFTENETNLSRLYASPNPTPFVKDAFHEAVVRGSLGAVNPGLIGTKCAAHHQMELQPGEERVLRLRLYGEGDKPGAAFGPEFEAVMARRQAEHAQFYEELRRGDANEAAVDADQARAVARQAYAGLIWSRQFYGYIVGEWLAGDPAMPPPPAERGRVPRNRDWPHLYARDVISVPDKWEYPWFASWDLAFHMLPFARIDPEFAKGQLNLLLREWYMHPSGQIPAYEWNFSDVNPPVHAWAVWRVYKMTGPRGGRDRLFLARVFQKLLLNFTWWVNRKDPGGNHIFSGGFLGLDNIGIFDRSKPLPGGGSLEQADGTAWMAFYCGTMLSMALELAEGDPAYEDIASKFFEHFVAIADAMNTLGGTGLWHEEDGFYYDQLLAGGRAIPLRIRSIVGTIPLLATEIIEDRRMERLPGFAKRTRWFLKNRADLTAHISYLSTDGQDPGRRLLAIPSKERLRRMLAYLFDEKEFLSAFGIRSLSRHYAAEPYTLHFDSQQYRIDYEPGESTTGLFGGNSNWRGPVWFPVNYLIIEALERYHYFFGDRFTIEFPTGSGRPHTLQQIACELARRLATLFLPDAAGRRPALAGEPRFASDPHWRDCLWFHEYFHGDSGRGLGANHQTGWTSLIIRILEEFV